MAIGDLLRVGAIVVFILSGVLLLGETAGLRTALALDSFALAAWAASAVVWRP